MSDNLMKNNLTLRIAYLILAHKGPSQVARLIHRLNTSRASFYIHIDVESPIEDFKQEIYSKVWKNIHWISKREKCKWGGFGIVQATLNGISQILKDGTADYVILLSGEDYPIKPIKYIENFFRRHSDTVFLEYVSLPYKRWQEEGLNRFPNFHKVNKIITLYGGSQWWSMPVNVIKNVLILINDSPDLVLYYKLVSIPDESFFHTIVLYLQHEIGVEIINNNMRFIDWNNPSKGYPAILGIHDFNAIQSSNCLFARKFNQHYDSNILDAIDEQILSL